jgi:parallel beta-helix repeat protein
VKPSYDAASPVDRSLRRTALAIAASVLAVSAARAAIFTVTNTDDSGAGSLRQAILDANANAGTDTIAFNIPGAGVHTISPLTAFANITQPVIIDGYTQPGSAVNTDPIADNATILIELEGSASSGGSGLRIMLAAAGSTVRGLVLNRWSSQCLELNGGTTVTGSFIGTDPSGLTAPLPEVGDGIWGPGASTTVGGAAPADRNVISGNLHAVNLPAANGHVLGNLIGLDATGEKALPNLHGVWMQASPNALIESNVVSGNKFEGIVLNSGGTIRSNIVGLSASRSKAIANGNRGVIIASPQPVVLGGSAPGDGNVIAANGGFAVDLSFSDATVVQGNFIGTDATSTIPYGNGGGINMVSTTDCVIGGVGPGEANVIAYNARFGVALFNTPYPSRNTIRGNTIHSNGPWAYSVPTESLGIDLGLNGATANDVGDADVGANGLQNFPIVLSAGPDAAEGTGTRVQGALHSKPSADYILDFYYNPACAPRPRAFAEAAAYLGSTNVSTDGAGDAVFDVTFAHGIAAGESVTATATDSDGNTSEISPRIVFSISPQNGPAAGGSSVTIKGTDFAPAAAVSIAGLPAGNVAVTDSQTITATTPALPPGSVGDLTISNPGGASGTFARAWVSDFLDSGDATFFYPYVVTLVANGVTAGCGGGNYCPNANVTRAQMAAFLLKAKHGLCYTPASCSGDFTDVACPSLFADWIEALADEGITGGCGGTNYCPGNPVRRDQMAAFLLKAEHGSTYAPPACTGVFNDVLCPSTFANWIEQLAAEQITGGCGGSDYCPLNPNTRGQMAVFLTKTFNLR